MHTLASVLSRMPSKILLPSPQPIGEFQVLAPEDQASLLCAATGNEAKPSREELSSRVPRAGDLLLHRTLMEEALPWSGTRAHSPQDDVHPGPRSTGLGLWLY